MIKKTSLLLFCLLCAIIIPAFAQEDALLNANVPYIYGEDNFIARINARTQGEREPIGLVLSGGSARAFAHIGVLKYLEENDIVPDYIISNSMGSIIGLFYAAGYSPEQIYEICYRIPLTSLFDITVPINSGVLNVQNFLSYAAEFVPKNADIKNFDIPIMVVQEDLKTKQKILVTEGDFLQVLQASFALPFYFDSIEYKDHLLIDGGMANIIPLDIAYKYGNKNIVSTTFYANQSLNLKNPITSLNTSIDIGKRREGVKQLLNHPDAIWIRCAVEDISFMEFSKLDYLKNQGYKSAQQQAEKLTELSNQNESLITQKINEQRKELGKLIVKKQNEYLRYNHVDSLKLTNTIGVSLWNSSLDSDYFFLSDSLGFGISNKFRWEKIELNTTIGVESQIDNGGWVYPGANLNTTFFLNKLKLSLSVDYIFKVDSEKITSEGLYANQFLKFNIKNSDALKFNIIETTEYIKDEENLRKSSWDETGGLSSLIFQTELNTKRNYLNINLGPQLVWEESDITPYIFGKLSNTLFIANSPLFIKGSTTTRFTVNKADSVFLSMTDGYCTTNKDFFSYGIPAHTSEVENKKNQLIIAGLETGYVSTIRPSFGEVILLDSMSISAFTNFIWFNREHPEIFDTNFGINISTNSSLIGLSTMGTKFTISYDTSNKDIYFGIIINK